MAIVIEGGIDIGPGIDIGDGSGPGPSANLVLSLDAGNSASYPGSGTTWTDTIGSIPFSLLNGVTYDSGDGGSLVFDTASNQSAVSSTSLSNLSTWTVEAWHYYDGTNNPSLLPCLVTETFVGGNINYTLGWPNGSPNFQAGFFNGAWQTTPTGYTLTPGDWYQIVGTYDGSTIKLYVNNTLINQTSYTGTPTSSGAGIRLMERWDSNDYWGGKLAIVKIYDGDIGASGVTTSWNANKARFGLGGNPGVNNVVGYTQMDPPIVPGTQLEDGTATVNGSTGFTINDDQSTGIAMPGLTSSNVNWFAANYTQNNYYTVTWGPGSTVASSSIYVIQVPGSWPGNLVFFVQGQTGAATYNYPFTFST